LYTSSVARDLKSYCGELGLIQILNCITHF